jgi:hypothetical protein
MAHPDGTVELDPQGPGAQKPAELGDPRAVGRKQIVVNIDMAHPEMPPQVAQVLVDIFG